MNVLQRFIYGREPRTAIIKQKAHLFTLLAILWSAFSLIGVILLPSRDHGSDMGWFLALGVWAAHLIWILLAVYFWIAEKPKRVLIPDSGDDGVDLV